MATTDMQRLVVSLEARVDKFTKAMDRANGVATRRARQIEGTFTRLNTRMATIGRGWFAGITAGLGAREIKELADAATRIDNALKVAGLAGAELEDVYQRLRKSALDNAAPFETLAHLYGRAALAQDELNVTSEELLNFTDKVAVALRVSGKSAAESRGALIQLSQAIGAGVVRAEEFNSILEGALPIAQAAAAGLKEAGGSVAKLRTLIIDGKVSSEAFFRAFEAGAPILEEKVANAVFTIDQRLGNLRTALIDAWRRFNTSTQAANTFGEAIDNVADFVNGIDFDALISEISELIDAFRTGIKWANGFAQSIGRATGLDVIGEGLVQGLEDLGLNTTGVIQSSRLMDKRFGILGAGGALPGGGLTDDAVQDFINRTFGDLVNQNKVGQLPAKSSGFTPVSLSDYATPNGKGSAGSKSRVNELEREIQQIKERTAAIQAETAAMSGLNPLIDDYDFAITRARASADLLAAAQKAGLEITPQLETQIEALATVYANATVEANKLAIEQDRVRERAEEMKALGKDVLGGFISDLRAGKSGAEALANALDKVADKLIDIALNSLFDGKGGGLLGGIIGGIGKIFGFAEGGVAARGRPYGPPLKKFARGGISKEAAIFGEAGPEAAVPLPDGRRIPVDLRMPKVPEMPAAPQTGGHITIDGVFAVKDGELVPLIASVSGQVAGKMVKQANKNFLGRAQSGQTRGT